MFSQNITNWIKIINRILYYIVRLITNKINPFIYSRRTSKCLWIGMCITKYDLCCDIFPNKTNKNIFLDISYFVQSSLTLRFYLVVVEIIVPKLKYICVVLSFIWYEIAKPHQNSVRTPDTKLSYKINQFWWFGGKL